MGDNVVFFSKYLRSKLNIEFTDAEIEDLFNKISEITQAGGEDELKSIIDELDRYRSKNKKEKWKLRNLNELALSLARGHFDIVTYKVRPLFYEITGENKESIPGEEDDDCMVGRTWNGFYLGYGLDYYVETDGLIDFPIIITKPMAKKWNVMEEELYGVALRNVRKYCSPQIYRGGPEHTGAYIITANSNWPLSAFGSCLVVYQSMRDIIFSETKSPYYVYMLSPGFSYILPEGNHTDENITDIMNHHKNIYNNVFSKKELYCAKTGVEYIRDIDI